MTNSDHDVRDAGDYEQSVVSWNINALLNDRELSKSSLSEPLGISRQAVYAKLTGNIVWTVPDLAAVAEFFGVSAQSLLDGSLMEQVKGHLETTEKK
ncbi:MAG: helix-turn-helix domain-containing protein [Bifidobacteriales bacterium]|nr:helix-turn-helix domain-containing protein [Bifidobacteriales bacterium]